MSRNAYIQTEKHGNQDNDNDNDKIKDNVGVPDMNGVKAVYRFIFYLDVYDSVAYCANVFE
jgi:hypothetical protein